MSGGVSSEADLADLVRSARGPLCIVGGGTRGLTGAGGVLATRGLSGVRLYEPGALTLVVGAGTPLREVEALLSGERQRLAFEPGDWRGLTGAGGEPTIGGVIAANISGPRRVQAGAARDATLGVRFVDGAGAIVKNGGRVMKNVTGYDLVKLMAGSYGTLGILTEVALKVLPVPERTATIRLAGLSLPVAVRAMTAALRSPYDVTGAARMPDGSTFFRVEGFAQSVDYRAGRLVALLASEGEAEVIGAADAQEALWRAVRDVAPFHGRPGDVWRLSVVPGEAAAIAARLPGEVMLDWGGGLIWALVPEGTDARALAAPYPGHATRVRGTGGGARFEPEAPAVAALTRALRARFDTRGIFNPGLMG